MFRRLTLFVPILLLVLASPLQANDANGLTYQVFDNWTGQYNWYNEAPPIPPTTPMVASGVVDAINHSWGGGPVMGTDLYEDVVVRYQGWLMPPENKTYYLCAFSDDGFQLYLDGSLVIDDWYDRGPSCGSTADADFSDGNPKELLAWYYENGGGALSVLMYYTDNGWWEAVPSSWYAISEPTPVTTTTTSSTTVPPSTTLPPTTTLAPTTTVPQTTTSVVVESSSTSVADANETTTTVETTLPEAEETPTTTSSSTTFVPPTTTSMTIPVPEAPPSPPTQTTVTPAVPVDTSVVETTTTSSTLTESSVENGSTTLVDTVPRTSVGRPPTTQATTTSSSDPTTTSSSVEESASEKGSREEGASQEIVGEEASGEKASEQVNPQQQVLVLAASTEPLSVEQVDAFLDQVDVSDLTEEQVDLLVQVLNEAPDDAKEAFEDEVNVFGDGFDAYVPAGSTIPVSQRRLIIAATAAVFVLPNPTPTARKPR